MVGRLVFVLFAIALFAFVLHGACLAQPLQAGPAEAIEEAVGSPERSDKDRARDGDRKPREILAFFGIEPGMAVLDLFSGGGYYTELVSRTVGPQGRVVAHNNEAYVAYVGAEIEQRYGNERLPNVMSLTVEANDLDLEPASLDAAIAILTWHDFYYLSESWPKIDTARLVGTLCTAIKPGGVLGVVDHVAAAGSDPWESGQNLHRIDPQRIRADLKNSCFEFDGQSDVLRNPADDHSLSMGYPAVRGKTDRVVYRFVRRQE